MPRVMLTARVTDTQAAALKSYAADVGLPLYQATVRALELGIAALVGGKGAFAAETPKGPDAVASASELAALREAVDRMAERNEQMATRAELSDRLIQRTLYAAGAAYAASLAGPGQGDDHKAEVARDAERIFDRQLAKARES